MLTVEQALNLLFSTVSVLDSVEINIEKAYGNIIAEDVFAPIDLPLFDASSVDGYAISYEDINNHQHYKIVEEIKAGDHSDIALNPGECVRLFTGAMVPATATQVVMQEFVVSENGVISFNQHYKPGNYIRRKGTQIRKGEPALHKNTFLNPGSVGFLASLGISHVKVYRKPEISIIVTGNEIINPGETLEQGQIYESNSYSLIAALQEQYIEPLSVTMVADERELLKKTVLNNLSKVDILCITGGVSVGKYDFVNDVLSDIGAETIFYKVAQRPGKPLLFARLNGKLIFGLPGNPASVLNCFYEYVYPAIRIMRGYTEVSLKKVQLKLLKEISNEGDRASFIRAKIKEEGVMPLDKQDSGMMLSFAGGNALIYIPAEKKILRNGEIVEVHLLPFNQY